MQCMESVVVKSPTILKKTRIIKQLKRLLNWKLSTPESMVGAEFVEFWLLPGDNSERLSINPNEGNTISHMYSGYGAFMAEFGVIDSLGNEDSFPYSPYDWPAIIRSANFYLNQTQASEPANLFVDAPNPNSVGSAERMAVESTIGTFLGTAVHLWTYRHHMDPNRSGWKYPSDPYRKY